MYSTDDLVHRAVQALRKRQKVEAAKVSFTTAELAGTNAGVEAGVEAHAVDVQYRSSLPDILAYLQNESELTGSTLVRILKESGRLSEFFVLEWLLTPFELRISCGDALVLNPIHD
jgi:type III restriction enzyme